ncbi:MAG: hypothetical protein H6858_05095 [Rhodospirillales bacterium]|nr:hypothetical protein [Alphaproteobacteria bacterium]MCB1839799.1 hypothetical protein [Alphaproteobacteria bacterium]MCB9976957.1 hypothetical protein [Rhodospirillales bacterium]
MSVRIGIIGDSLGANFAGPGYAAYLDEILTRRGWNVEIDNRSQAGAASDYGPSAARALVSGADKPDIVVLELGGNDLKVQLSPSFIRQNLANTIEILQEHNVTVVLSGAIAPSWAPSSYKQEFDQIYTGLAREYGVILDPFILDSLVQNPEGRSLREVFNQRYMADEIHPNYLGARLVAEDLADEIEQALRARSRSSEVGADESVQLVASETRVTSFAAKTG